MKSKLLIVFLIVFVSGMYSQKKADNKWRVTELDSLSIAQDMFDDQNFVMALPYITQIQMNHPEEDFLKYLAGICCLFKEGNEKHGLDLLLLVYENNKKAEDIELYLALGYHYNKDFEQALSMLDKYLSKKHLTASQKRVGEKLKDYCMRKEILVAPPDEGRLEDYLIASDTSQEEVK